MDETYNMTGGTITHSLVSTNTTTAMSNGLHNAKQNCLVINSDLKVYIARENSFVYPDAMIVCQKPVFFNNTETALINPILIVEVLSKSTEAYDRGEKFRKYRTSPSLCEYVLISTERQLVETFYRPSGTPSLAVFCIRPNCKNLLCCTIGVDVSLYAIYQQTNVAP
ncbi:MAG: Uma2 family endonuclease [Sphingobacteriales bacterium]|nr:Uma2 family endonuclease [Sphingobacteriales bacterium]